VKTRILATLLSLIFLASGGAKLAGLEFEIAAFERWGYPLWFMYLTGVIEVAGGIGLLLRRFSALASAGLAAMMVGAIATHVIHAEWGMLAAASIIFGMAVWRAFLGRGEIAALAGARFAPAR
jgi:uncharacterized membrane protein YphA (DoxX/SURF4 family)